MRPWGICGASIGDLGCVHGGFAFQSDGVITKCPLPPEPFRLPAATFSSGMKFMVDRTGAYAVYNGFDLLRIDFPVHSDQSLSKARLMGARSSSGLFANVRMLLDRSGPDRGKDSFSEMAVYMIEMAFVNRVVVAVFRFRLVFVDLLSRPGFFWTSQFVNICDNV